MKNDDTKNETAPSQSEFQRGVSSNIAPPLPRFPWPDPKPEDLEKEDFNLAWECIKTWDINVPEVDGEGMYTGATGNHVMQILFATGKRNITDYC